MKRILIKRLQLKFRHLIEDYMETHGYSQGQVADQVGLQRTHLNALLRGNRPLSTYYLEHFLNRGIIKMAEIYDRKPKTDAEMDFWADAEFIEKHRKAIARARRLGIDLDSLIDDYEKGHSSE